MHFELRRYADGASNLLIEVWDSSASGLTAASWIMEPFGEIGANFLLQLSSGTQFAKISNKKVIAENQREKH